MIKTPQNFMDEMLKIMEIYQHSSGIYTSTFDRNDDFPVVAV